MSVIIIDRTKNKERKGRNLRVILDFAREMGFLNVHDLSQDGVRLHVHFADGSTCDTNFADATVLTGWINDRVKYGRGRWRKRG